MSWIQTHSGIAFDVLDPDPEAVCIEDIATALGKLCRFNGHTTRFYSVAEHSVHMSYVLEGDGLALEGLLHDAAEAYVGDVARPLKEQLDGFAEIEGRVLDAVAEAFGLSFAFEQQAAVKEADLRMLATERDQLLVPCERPWQSIEGVASYRRPLGGWTPEQASATFLHRFSHITNDTDR